MKVTLRTKKLSNGNESIYLDITDKGERRYEYLRLYLVPEVDATAKRLNANAMKKANEIRNKFILGQNKPKTKDKDSDSITITLMEWYDEYERHMLQDRNISVAVKDHLHLLRPILEGFLKEKRLKHIKLKAFGRKEVLGFINYMKDWKAEKREKLSQGTMVTYQQRFIALFNAAIEEGLIDRNPFNLIDDKERIQKYIANKEALTMEEVEKFANVTPGKEEDAEVQRAFLFGCLTGLRLSDIRDLEWKDIKVATLSTCAQLERDSITFRLQSGYKQYREKGGKVGRKPGSVKSEEQKREEYKDVITYLNKGYTIRDVSKLSGKSVSSVQRVKKAFL